MSRRLTIVGLRPNPEYSIPLAVQEALASATHIYGYESYLDRIIAKPHQNLHVSDNRVELDRARTALDAAVAGGDVVIISGGDPDACAVATVVFDAIEKGPEAWRGVDIVVEPAVTAMLAGGGTARSRILRNLTVR